MAQTSSYVSVKNVESNTPYTVSNEFEKPEVQGILLIDAKNAFKSLNRDLALRNIENICPSIVTALKNSYKSPTSLFVNGKTMQSQDGTAQGDSLVMAMYGIAILPLIELVQDPKITQKWYADDGNVAGSLDDMKVVHDKLKQHGSAFGYTLTKWNIITETENINQAKKNRAMITNLRNKTSTLELSKSYHYDKCHAKVESDHLV